MTIYRRSLAAAGLALGLALWPLHDAWSQTTLRMWTFLNPGGQAPREKALKILIDRFEAANPGGVLKIGQFATATVPIGGTVVGVAIPNGAILDDNGTPVAYVQAGGETFERRALTVGASDARRTQVLDGIRVGEMVVTTGAYQVRLASMSGSSFAGAHAH